MIQELQMSCSQERLEFGMGLNAQRGTVGSTYLFIYLSARADLIGEEGPLQVFCHCRQRFPGCAAS